MKNGFIQLESIWTIVFICVSLLLIGLLVILAMHYRNKVLRLNEELRNRTGDFEIQVEKAKAAANAKSDFLSRMSHEIRTPLNAIIGLLQILRSSHDADKTADYMEKMEDSSRHLMGLINDILDFSKLETDNLILDKNSFSLARNIDFVVSMFKEKIATKHLNFSVELNDIEHDGIETDMLRLNQVLINLLSNAIKFTDENGNIIFLVEELAHLNDESVYKFTVQDDGVGIEPEQAKKLFTPFTQANASVSRIYGGTGLGLSIAQSIVQMMGGEIEIQTKPGYGSSFFFTIKVPATVKAKEEIENKRSSDEPRKDLSGKRILIVDDIEINREIVAALLEDSNVLVEMAANGKEALDIFCASEPHWFDFILMDMLMPVMDGCEATTAIRDSNRADSQEVRIVAMTANVLHEDMERAYNAGMKGFLTKPIELDLLYAKLEELL